MLKHISTFVHCPSSVVKVTSSSCRSRLWSWRPSSPSSTSPSTAAPSSAPSSPPSSERCLLPSSTGTNTKFFQAILQPCSAGEVLWRRQLLLAGLWDSGSSHGCSNCRHNSRFSQKVLRYFSCIPGEPFLSPTQ
jgi:hypothetical protein